MIDLIGKKNYFFALSALIIIAGIVGFIFNGLQLDIQFQGGTIMQIQMPDNNYDTVKAENIVMQTIQKKANVQKSSTFNAEKGGSTINLMVLNIASKDTLNQSQRTQVLGALRKEFNIKTDAQITVSSVEPFIGKELEKDALLAVFWASFIIILYVWWRFKVMSGLSAGVMAVVAMLHDILIMFSFYVIFKIPINDLFVAAVLTVIGYSMNDTIIIYDRIRENSSLLRKVPIGQLVNKSVVQTLNRSINTVVTVLICLVTTFIFASFRNITSIRDFTLPLIVGITSGCYSSIFIASSLYVVWMEHQTKKKISSRPVKA
jgi:preprotein translocase subunit SecF